MNQATPSHPGLNELVDKIVASYRDEKIAQHLDSPFLPSRSRTVEIIELLRKIIFPGFFDDHRLTSDTIHFHVGGLLATVHALLYDQVHQALRYEENRPKPAGAEPTVILGEAADVQARRITETFLDKIPEFRRLLALDAMAAFDSDPAARGTDETIFCYPGMDAIFIHRMAHELWILNVPLLPRIMSEYAHNETGIDIHPGATIGESFFIDHGTGIVIGETCIIGKRVKIYQGVTLGAISTKGGQAWRGSKRHPTIEDEVTIYAGAVVLGGGTTIGKGATINGSVFVTQSVPPGHTVSMKPPELKVTVRKPKREPSQTDAGQSVLDASFEFDI